MKKIIFVYIFFQFLTGCAPTGYNPYYYNPYGAQLNQQLYYNPANNTMRPCLHVTAGGGCAHYK